MESPPDPLPHPLLNQALAFQVDALGSDRSNTAEDVFDQFPQLKGNSKAELAIVYNEYRLSDGRDRASKREELLKRYPEHSEGLLRQIRFAHMLETMEGDPSKTLTDHARRTGRENHGPRYTVDSLASVGRFEIEQLLGHGGMGSVFLAQDKMLGRPVAIKVPRSEFCRGKQTQERFLREAQLAARLRHPNLLEVHEVGEWEGGCYIATHWAQAGDLSQFLSESRGPFNAQDVLQLMIGIAAGLSYCHQQDVVHLDLKPANILFDRPEDVHTGDRVNGNGSNSAQSGTSTFPGKPLLADFGLARVIDHTIHHTETSALLGTPLYMAPEQIECDRSKIGPATDVFSLGVIMYELLYGERPFQGKTAIELIDQVREGRRRRPPTQSDVPADLRRVCERCLCHEPEGRYASATELHADLQRVARGESIERSSPIPWTRMMTWMERRERILQGAAIALFFNCAVLCAFVLPVAMGVFSAGGQLEGLLQDYLYDGAKLILFPHLPIIVTSLAILRGRLKLFWLNAVLSFVLVGLVTSALVAGESPVSIYDSSPIAFYMAHCIIFGISFCQLVAQLVAIPAALRLRRGV